MRKFIELRFGQGDMGKHFIDGKEIERDDLFVQRELVPTKAIKDAYIVLPEKRNIRISFKIKGRMFTRTEYYKNEVDCIKRWCFLRKSCGLSFNDSIINPVPLPMDAEEMEKVK